MRCFVHHFDFGYQYHHLSQRCSCGNAEGHIHIIIDEALQIGHIFNQFSIIYSLLWSLLGSCSVSSHLAPIQYRCGALSFSLFRFILTSIVKTWFTISISSMAGNIVSVPLLAAQSSCASSYVRAGKFFL